MRTNLSILTAAIVALGVSACAKAPAYEGKWVPSSVECLGDGQPAKLFIPKTDQSFTLTVKDENVTTTHTQTAFGVADIVNETIYLISESKENDLTVKEVSSKQIQGDSVIERDTKKEPTVTFVKGTLEAKGDILTVRGFMAPGQTGRRANARTGQPAQGGSLGQSEFAFDRYVDAKDENGQPTAICGASTTADKPSGVKNYIYKKAN